MPDDARAAVIEAADRIVRGDWSLLGVPRPDIDQPDWFLDPATGRRAPQTELAFRIDHRDEAVTGNVKCVWELSRHHHLTVVATAYWLTGDDVYADLVARQLKSWWAENPFLSGVHWTNGIELGIRLISWTWIRRLLNDWPKVGDVFDTNDDALRQIWWHQSYLATFRSRGSSANNHVIAEAAGRLVAACAFPWYAESESWRADAAAQLGNELQANTFDSGVNRELATDYQLLVAELGLLAGVEADAAGAPLAPATWALLARSLDAAAALVDVTGRPPRQGDGDEGRALVVDGPAAEPWPILLGVGAQTVGAMPWWPRGAPSVAAVVVGALSGAHATVEDRPSEPPLTFLDAGLALLRTPRDGSPEIWCRFDAGPHGFLSIAAHAHADAMSVEVRYDGVDVLADPGTYCYHGEPEWRSYFRSTLAHNTIEIDGTNQSVDGGPFMWTAHAHSEMQVAQSQEGTVQVCMGEHDGYGRLDKGLSHARTVALDSNSRHLSIVDLVSTTSDHSLKIAFHLGPEVSVVLRGTVAELQWPTARGTAAADLHLPGQLHWSQHHGETQPVLGWYSPRFGEKVPSTTLLGTGSCDQSLELRTLLVFPSD